MRSEADEDEFRGMLKVDAAYDTPPQFEPEEGGPCHDPECHGKLEFEEVENCTCFQSAPCGRCEAIRLECVECGWREGDDE